MAHFAKIGMDNIVLEVVVVNNIDSMTDQGVHDESVGIEFLRKLTGHQNWVQTSYSGNIRGKFAAIGDTYNSANDEFVSIAEHQEIGAE